MYRQIKSIHFKLFLKLKCKEWRVYSTCAVVLSVQYLNLKTLYNWWRGYYSVFFWTPQLFSSLADEGELNPSVFASHVVILAGQCVKSIYTFNAVTSLCFIPEGEGFIVTGSGRYHVCESEVELMPCISLHISGACEAQYY